MRVYKLKIASQSKNIYREVTDFLFGIYLYLQGPIGSTSGLNLRLPEYDIYYYSSIILYKRPCAER
jgi:hypothetical protein